MRSRFAKGEPLTAHTGETAELRRPLDFLLVSDHAEYLGVLPGVENGHPELDGTSLQKRWAEWLAANDTGSIIAEYIGTIDGTRGLDDYVSGEFLNAVWQEIGAIADRHNEPGRFTAFIGYEWTTMVDGDNLHRIVLFRDDAEATKDVVPFSALDSNDPEDLWQWLSDYESDSGAT